MNSHSLPEFSLGQRIRWNIEKLREANMLWLKERFPNNPFTILEVDPGHTPETPPHQSVRIHQHVMDEKGQIVKAGMFFSSFLFLPADET